MEEVKFIPKELLQAVKNIPVQNVMEKIFKDMEYKEDRTSTKFEVYKNAKYTAFLNPIENNVTVKRNDNNETWIGNAYTVGLVERAKFWDFWDSNNKKNASRKEMFKKSVLWLAEEFDLIKSIDNGKIKLDLKEIHAVENKSKEVKEDYLYRIEQKMEEAKVKINSFKNMESLEFDNDFRDIDKNLMNLLVKSGGCKLIKNKEKGNSLELRIALKNTEGEIQGIQRIFYNINTKRWDKRNVGDAQVAWFGNKQAENMVITESFLDSASAAQVISFLKDMNYREVLDNYLFISVNGQYSNLKKEIIKNFLTEGSIKKVILAHDNDKAGESFDKIYLKNGEFWDYVKDKKLVVFKPANVKDFNDFIRSDIFKTNNFKDELIMQKAKDYYRNYLKEVELEERLEKEAVLGYVPEEEVEEKNMADAEVKQSVVDSVDAVESIKNITPPALPALPGNVKISEILEDLMESKTVNGKTNYFYKLDEESVKFTKFTAKMKGVTKKGIYSVFFKENDYIEVNKNGKEKGTGVSILYGKNIKNRKDIKNIIFSTNMVDALKLLKLKGINIKNSVIIGIKSASVESQIIYEQLAEHLFWGNSINIKNVFVIGNEKKNGQFLESLLNNEKTMYNIGFMKWDTANLEVYNESDLKNVRLEIDVLNNTAPGKEMERNLKKEKEPVLSV